MSVAELAAQVGVGRGTIRYYERVGLHPAPPRTTGDHRRYPAHMVDRLRFIQGCQRLGLDSTTTLWWPKTPFVGGCR